jgi:APA family basic amino acid/polyamine antiporter
LPGTLYLALGPAAPLAYILGAALFAPIVLCFAAAGSRFTTTGGPYRYVEAAFGRYAGLLIAALFWISNVAGSGGMAAILVSQATHILPALQQPLPRSLFLAAVYAGLYALNARGVRLGARAIIVFAAAKMLPLLLLAIGGLMYIHPENLRITTAPDGVSLGKSLVVAIFAYSGIETALAPSGELRDPARVVPGAALVGVSIVVVLYVSLQIAAQGILGPALAGNDAPLSAVAERLLPGSAGLVIVTASVSLIGVLLGDLLGSSRLLYALAQDGFLPAALASVSPKHRVPTRAIFAHAAAAWVLAASGTFNTLALVSGAAFCIVYIACCAAAWQLQRVGAAETSAPLRLPAGGLIPAIGITCLILVLLATLG